MASGDFTVMRLDHRFVQFFRTNVSFGGIGTCIYPRPPCFERMVEVHRGYELRTKMNNGTQCAFFNCQ